MPPERDEDMTAAELALGLLEGEERAASLRRMLAEPGFAREVEKWRSHFSIMFAEVQSVEPPREVFTRIETALTPPRARKMLWPVISAALAASLVLVLLLRPIAITPPSTTASTLVATLNPADKGVVIPVIYDSARGEIRVASAELTAPGRSAELWVIGRDGAPRALGLLSPRGKSVVAVPVTSRGVMEVGNKLAISSEPVGGSTTGKPTGPILAIGTFISV